MLWACAVSLAGHKTAASPSGSRPLADRARRRIAPLGSATARPRDPFPWKLQAITVAILTQGTHCAVAHTQAFCLPGLDPRPAQRASPKGKGERQRQRGRCRHVSIARSSTVVHEDISRGAFSLNPLLREFSLWGIFVLPPFVKSSFPVSPCAIFAGFFLQGTCRFRGFSP